MKQTNSVQRESETRGPYNEPIARFDEFERITKTFYDEYNILHPLRNPNPGWAYWNKGELLGPPFQYFKHIAYKSLESSKPDLGLALEGAYIDVGPDIEHRFEEVGYSFKCWMTLLVHYEPVNRNDETHKGIDAYISASLTKIFKRFGIISGWGNPYRFGIGILTDKIKELNAQLIRDKSGLVPAGINKLYLKNGFL